MKEVDQNDESVAKLLGSNLHEGELIKAENVHIYTPVLISNEIFINNCLLHSLDNALILVMAA